MNILFLSIICSTILASTSSYGMELPNKNNAEKSTDIWSFPLLRAIGIIPSQNKIESDWEEINDETDKTRSKTSSPIQNIETVQTKVSSPAQSKASSPICMLLTSSSISRPTSSNSLNFFSLQNPNSSEKPSKKPTILETHAANHDKPWEKTNSFNVSRLHESTESLDSITSSEKNFISNNPKILNVMFKEKHEKISQMLTDILQKKYTRISQPESSPIERTSQPKPSATENDQSPSSSPKSQMCNTSLLSWIVRTFTSTMKQIDKFVDEMVITENNKAE